MSKCFALKSNIKFEGLNKCIDFEFKHFVFQITKLTFNFNIKFENAVNTSNNALIALLDLL